MDIVNGTIATGIQNYGGGNFVDVLFKHLLENGWTGFSFYFIFQFYLYMSLKRINEFCSYVNDKIAYYGKEVGEKYTLLVTACISSYWTRYISVVMKELSKIDLTTLKTLILENIGLTTEKKKEHYEVFSAVDHVIVDFTSPKVNKFSSILNVKNKMDSIALGNYILKWRQQLNLSPTNMRSQSDRYKTTETYDIPETLSWTLTSDQRVNVTLKQEVDFKIMCETDTETEILKDISIKIPEESIMKVGRNEFYNIVNEWELAYERSNAFSETLRNYPCFDSKLFSDSNMSPVRIYGGAWKGFLFLIYYNKDIELFRRLNKFLIGQGTFWYNGKEYLLTSHYMDRCEVTTRLSKSSVMDIFVEELATYCDVMRKHIDDRGDDSIEKGFLEYSKNIFEPAEKFNPAFVLEYESEYLSEYELSVVSRNFMNQLILDYYQKNADTIGNKISIYKLQIEYETEYKNNPNPAYKAWEDKYGVFEPDLKKRNNSSDDESSDSDSTNDNDSSRGSKKKKSNKKKKDKAATDMYGDDIIHEYGHGHGYGQMYTPPAPTKTISVEIKVPVVESQLIKTDKKPFQYLYLQKSYKDKLESYLKNFKEKKENYEKFGFPYKGGILLNGNPGCGKSSTIMAIATYLNKDVYYLDLGRIKTNSELKMCIDHINTNSQNGGVIIFEDIDCMSNVVLKRTSDVQKEKVGLQSEVHTEGSDALSLSFLLNILDGTMAPENVIFIMTTNHIEKLDPALIRPGRMDINIELKKCDRYQLKCIFRDLYSRELPQDLLDRFKEYDHITAEVILHLFHNIYNEGKSDEELVEPFLQSYS